MVRTRTTAKIFENLLPLSIEKSVVNIVFSGLLTLKSRVLGETFGMVCTGITRELAPTNSIEGATFTATTLKVKIEEVEGKASERRWFLKVDSTTIVLVEIGLRNKLMSARTILLPINLK